MPAAAAADPEAPRTLPPQLVAPIVDAYAAAIDYVFRSVVPVALVGFLVAWFLEEVPLRDSARANAGDMGDGFAIPHPADRILLEQALENIATTLLEARAQEVLPSRRPSGLLPEDLPTAGG
ncbi:hypothetical protein [Nocardia brevicatena]|uniref:hypothetical protein n=1 Tax=Nocardia brevicatena TaxID=37327 RepID=UPI0002E90D98|nr:hypothetical protein [Nocardia brevicatena]